MIKKQSKWQCNCGVYNKEMLPTDRRTLTCSKCGLKYWIRGMHIDGSPMLGQIGKATKKEGKDHAKE